MSFFFIIDTILFENNIFESTFKQSYIQNQLITNHHIKRFRCIAHLLLWLTMKTDHAAKIIEIDKKGIKMNICFLFLHKNKWCEHPQHIFSWTNKKKKYLLISGWKKNLS